MSPQQVEPDLPEFMTWEELERLSEDIAGEIELWDGRVVWVRRGPAEHQNFTGLVWSGLRRAAREARSNPAGALLVGGAGDECLLRADREIGLHDARLSRVPMPRC